MTPIELLAVALFVIPGLHLMIRRFQERFRSGWIHIALFFITCCFGAGLAAGWTAWLAVPVMAVVAAVSQYVYLKDGYSTVRREPQPPGWP